MPRTRRRPDDSGRAAAGGAVVVPSRRGRARSAPAAAEAVVVPSRPGTAGAPWRQYRGDGQGTGHAWWSTDLPRGRVVWSHPVGPMVDSSPVVDGNGVVYVGAGNSLDVDASAGRVLVAIGPDGSERWATGLEAEGTRYVVRATPAIRNDGRLIVMGGTGQMTVEGGRVTSVVGKGRLFLVAASGLVEHYWQEHEGPGTASPLLDADDTVYFWSLPPGKPMPYVVWKLDSQLASLTEIGGLEPKWTSDTPWWWIFDIFIHWDPAPLTATVPPPLLPSPVFGGYGDVLASAGRTVRCWTTAHNLWERDVAALTTPAVGPGGRAYIPTEGHLEAHDQFPKIALQAPPGGGLPRPSVELVHWKTGLGSSATAPPALGAAEGKMDPDDVPEPKTVSGAPAARDHRFGRTSSSPVDIYVPLANGKLAAFDYRGHRRWETELATTGLGAPVCIQHSATHEQRIVIGSADGSVFALDRDGRVVWQVDLDSPILGSPAPASGRVYVATQTAVYAIE
jgi:outer membrane protein assembly factor BamB